MRTAKALARLRGCTGLPEPLQVAYVISTIISCAGSFKAEHNKTNKMTCAPSKDSYHPGCPPSPLSTEEASGP